VNRRSALRAALLAAAALAIWLTGRAWTVALAAQAMVPLAHRMRRWSQT
jgi:hypothetical protein